MTMVVHRLPNQSSMICQKLSLWVEEFSGEKIPTGKKSSKYKRKILTKKGKCSQRKKNSPGKKNSHRNGKFSLQMKHSHWKRKILMAQ